MLIVLPFLGKSFVNLRILLYKYGSKILLQCNIWKLFFIFQCFFQKSRAPISYVFSLTFFKNLSVVIAVWLYMAKLNVVLKLEVMSIEVCPHSQEKGSLATKNLSLKITSFRQITCFLWKILQSWIMNHTRLNVLWMTLYSLPRINYYWMRKINFLNLNSFGSIPLTLIFYKVVIYFILKR